MIFDVVRFRKTENGRLYSVDAAVLHFECVCCLPAQHVYFVGRTIDVQKRTAEYVLRGLEFTQSYCEETEFAGQEHHRGSRLSHEGHGLGGTALCRI